MAEVKICGLSTPETMAAALEAGAYYVGLVFFAPSPRHVALRQAAALAEQARGRAEIVALTVDADDETIASIAREVRPHWLQLHGAETRARAQEIRSRTGIRLIKAIRVAAAEDVTAAQAHAGVADLILFDAKAEAGLLPGGNGLTFDWRLLSPAHAGAALPQPYILAGGLRPDNVAHAIASTRAPIVDVSSGVERVPGMKDIGLIRKFIEAARASR